MVELGLVEQRHQAVLEVLNEGVPITEVAARFGVTRQSVHHVYSHSLPAADRAAASTLGNLLP